jgi:hypothetical protein
VRTAAAICAQSWSIRQRANTRALQSLALHGVTSYNGETRATFAILILCCASIVLADDFKTVDGKEYKNVTVSRIEPDGIVKIPFAELSAEIQKKYGYNAEAATDYQKQAYEAGAARAQQISEAQQRQAEERAKYWEQRPTPQPQRSNTALGGSALDRAAFNQSTTADFLCRQYAQNEIAADRQYRGRVLTISGIIKTISSKKGETAVVELFVPLTDIGKTYFMDCTFSDTRGLEGFQAGNPISFRGTVGGVKGFTLEIKDCELAR